MAIYNIFDYYEKEQEEKAAKDFGPKIDPSAFTTNRIDEQFKEAASFKGHLFSALAARFFFFLLLLADLAWGVYAIASFALKSALIVLTFGQIVRIKESALKSWLSIKRSIVCAIALVIAIFSPALGIMFSCMYFLMYDRTGVDEVVPASLRDQFRMLFP